MSRFLPPEKLHGLFGGHVLYVTMVRAELRTTVCFMVLSFRVTMRRLESRHQRIKFDSGVLGCL